MEALLTKEFAVFFLVGVFGMVFHWAKRWVRNQTKTSLFKYIFGNPRYTTYAFMTYCMAIGGLVVSGIADFDSIQSLALAAATGYSVDSMVNKDLQDEAQNEDARDAFKPGR